MLLNDQPWSPFNLVFVFVFMTPTIGSHQNTPHISSETWTSFGKIFLPKKIILFIAEQTLSYNSITDWTINSLRGSRKESKLNDSIPKFFVTLWFIVLTTTSLTHRYTPAFHDLQVLIDQLMVVTIVILQVGLIGRSGNY